MTPQEIRHLRYLSWDILYDAKIKSLPIDINSISELFLLDDFVNPNDSLYENSILVSQKILEIYGYNNSSEYSQYLAIMLMSPMIILKALKVKSADEISKYTQLPIEISEQRYQQLNELIPRKNFCTSKLELKVYSRFKNWLKNINR